MSRDTLAAIGLAILAGAFLVSRAKAQPAPSPTGVVTIEPPEHVGGYGNVSPILVPRPGETTNVDYTITDPRRQLCACAPLKSYGPACEGVTWDNTTAGKTERRTRVAVDC